MEKLYCNTQVYCDQEALNNRVLYCNRVECIVTNSNSNSQIVNYEQNSQRSTVNSNSQRPYCEQ